MCNQRDSTDQDEQNSSVSVFQPIPRPVLTSFDAMKVAKFLCDQERYELEVAEEKKEVPTWTRAIYKVSVVPRIVEEHAFIM